MLENLAGRLLTRGRAIQRCVRLMITAALLVVTVLLAPKARLAQMGSVTVCASECDYRTIQAAIDASSQDTGVSIAVLDPVHTESGIRVDKSVTIVGASAADTIVQADTANGLVSERVFEIPQGADVTIQDMTIRHGRVTGSPARGGGILNEGSLTLERVAVTDNLAVGSDGNPGGMAEGGGIYNNGSLIVVSSVVSNNGVEAGNGSSSGADGGDGQGGGMANGTAGTLTIINSTVSSNTAVGGDGFG